jgi:hypothetical protein
MFGLNPFLANPQTYGGAFAQGMQGLSGALGGTPPNSYLGGQMPLTNPSQGSPYYNLANFGTSGAIPHAWDFLGEEPARAWFQGLLSELGASPVAAVPQGPLGTGGAGAGGMGALPGYGAPAPAAATAPTSGFAGLFGGRGGGGAGQQAYSIRDPNLPPTIQLNQEQQAMRANMPWLRSGPNFANRGQ